MSDPKHPGPARDISLAEWLDGVGFHPADTELKQRGHEAARLLAALYATHLHQLLPPGRLKSLAFTKLEEVLQRANQALAVGKGPHALVALPNLQSLVDSLKDSLDAAGATVPYDPRISQYEAEQRGEAVPITDALAAMDAAATAPVEPFEYRREHGGSEHYTQIEIGLTGVAGPEPEVKIGVVEHNEAENVTDGAELWVNDPDVLESIATHLLTLAAQLRALQAR